MKRIYTALKYKRVTMRHGLSYKQVQTNTFSVKAQKQEMSGLAIADQPADHSTIGDRQL